MSVSRHFATVGGRQIHYRRLGHGPAALLLHQSPASSAELVPLMRELAPRFTAIAPDMPGYGASDPWLDTHLRVDLLADALAAFLGEIGVDTAAVYGLHTGASVAVSLARRHPERVLVAVCEGLLCLEDDERGNFLARYIEPFVPRFDGSHLAWLWTRMKDQSLFFPWYERTDAARLDLDGTLPGALAEKGLEWLRAGAGYREGYAAAIAYDPRADLPFIRPPLQVQCHRRDPLSAHLERLPPLPSNIVVHRFDTVQAGYDLVQRALLRHPGSRSAPPPVPTRPLTGQVWQDYIPSLGTQVHVLRADAGDGRAAIVQHDAGSSLRACAGMVSGLCAARPVLAMELPGHGETDCPAAWDAGDMQIASLAELARGVLQGLGATDCDLIGVGAGATVQVEMARLWPQLAASLTLISAVDVTRDPALQAALLASYAPPQADSHGGYLLRAWHEVRDHLLFFPWYERGRSFAVTDSPRLDPEFLQARTVDVLLAGAAGVDVRKAEIRYPLLARLIGQPVTARLAAPGWEPRHAHTRGLAASSREFLTLSRDADRWGRDLASFPPPETQ